MKFPLLVISNFGTFGEGPTEINLADRGLFGIAGVNVDDSSADSNGAGKSTIPDALCWALYGTTARGVEGDEVVNRAAGKNCHVYVEIVDGDDAYAIIRYRKHTKEKNGLRLVHVDRSGVETDLTQGTEKLTQAKIDKILGCSYEVFKAAIYCGQEQQIDIPALTDKGLKVLVEEAGGITLLEECYGVALTEAKDAATALALALSAKASAESAEANAASFEITMKNEQLEWQKNRDIELAELDTAITVAYGEIKLRARALKKTDIAALRKEKDGLTAALSAVEIERATERDLQKAAVSTENERLRLYDQAIALKKDVEKRRKALAEHDSAAPGNCKECGQTIPDDPKARDAHKRAQSALIAERVSEFNELKKRVVEASERATAASKALDEHRKTMTDVSDTTAKLTKITGEISAYEMQERDITTLQKHAEKEVARQIELRKAVNPFDAKVAAANAARDDAEVKVADAIYKVEEAERVKVIADATVKVFGPAGVRAQELDRLTPYLNDRTAHYLSALSDGNITATWTTLTRNAKGELKEKFSIEVDHSKGGASYRALSGGEKQKVRKSCMLALQDLVASRATKPIDLWIGDEIDNALDHAGLERLFGVLEGKARERGTVAIISHNDMAAWLRDVVIVEKRGEVSSLVEA
jgi:DNA repair exonuclease SbcCD ATPase subunit